MQDRPSNKNTQSVEPQKRTRKLITILVGFIILDIVFILAKYGL